MNVTPVHSSPLKVWISGTGIIARFNCQRVIVPVYTFCAGTIGECIARGRAVVSRDQRLWSHAPSRVAVPGRRPIAPIAFVDAFRAPLCFAQEFPAISFARGLCHRFARGRVAVESIIVCRMEAYSLVGATLVQLRKMVIVHAACPHVLLARPVGALLDAILVQFTEHFAKSPANVRVWNGAHMGLWVTDEMWRDGDVDSRYPGAVATVVAFAVAVIHAFAAFCAVHLPIGVAGRARRGTTYPHALGVVEHRGIHAVEALAIDHRDTRCLPRFRGPAVRCPVFATGWFVGFNFWHIVVAWKTMALLGHVVVQAARVHLALFPIRVLHAFLLRPIIVARGTFWAVWVESGQFARHVKPGAELSHGRVRREELLKEVKVHGNAVRNVHRGVPQIAQFNYRRFDVRLMPNRQVNRERWGYQTVRVHG